MDKKVVDIEGRIPTIKERRRQLANRRLIVYVSIFFLLMMAVVYFQSPFSQVKSVKVQGNTHVSNDLITEISGLLDEVSIWRYDRQSITAALEEHPEISSVSLSRRLPNTVVIDVREYGRVAYIEQQGSFMPMLETGVVLTETDGDVQPYDAPAVYNFSEGEQLREMASELRKLPPSLHRRIAEVHLEPAENDPVRLVVFMTDGFEVHSTMRNFSERILPYPAVADQLEAGAAGIIHMRMTPYFESFESESTEEEEEIESEG
ncbi:cell division protein FtsQ/DivIB [Alteribacter natronophilus]|uniref:cell division protein FtsQ/DivIB n=1 Tax=Alteribacter natronophilus TaxID=2583810 RepID=UPI00110D2724|nr:FtsQ-type POTRA domain-containing protein [Alteribacter natronophilus]TMW73127.1 FtsQ-type POTRA domain-containing protein [Alteribacter natronophilus]